MEKQMLDAPRVAPLAQVLRRALCKKSVIVFEVPWLYTHPSPEASASSNAKLFPAMEDAAMGCTAWHSGLYVYCTASARAPVPPSAAAAV